MKPYVAFETPKIKVAPPQMPELDFTKIEVPLEQIIFPLQYATKQKIEAANAERLERKQNTEENINNNTDS